MAKMLVYEVIVPENMKFLFEELLKKSDIGFRDTGFFRVADLDAFISGEQKPI